MKILVFSDSHGRSAAMERAVSLHRGAEYLLHAGDGAAEFELLSARHPELACAGVRGNCDPASVSVGSPAPLSCTLEIGGKRIFLTHGHTFSVKLGTDALIKRAAEADADIAVFGHTHQPLELFIPGVGRNGLWLFNPGTVSGAGTGRFTYGIIEIRANGVLTSIADLFPETAGR